MRLTPARFRSARLLVAVLWMGACLDGGIPYPEEISLSVEGATRIHVGETLNLVATVLDGGGARINTADLHIQWTSSDEDVARVSSDGVVTAIAAGTATITATVELISASVAIEVVAVVSGIISLNAGDLSGSVGDALAEPVRVGLTDPQGNGVPGIAVSYAVLTGGGAVFPGRDVTGIDGTSATEWTLGPVAGVQQLEVRVVPPSAALGATASSALDDLVLVIEAEAEADPPAAIEVTPSELTLISGNEGSVTGTVVDQFGNHAPDQARFTIVWSSSHPSIASVAASGAVTGGAAGAATITGVLNSAPGIVGFSRVTVVPGSPASLSKVSGDEQGGLPGSALPAPLVVLVADGSGNPLPDIPVAWSVTSGDAALGSGGSQTDGSGLAMAYVTLGGTLGPVEITASVEGVGAAAFTATIMDAPVITTGSVLPDGREGVAYGEVLTATGGDGSYAWRLFNGTKLPAGLELNPETGSIRGTPSEAGTTIFEVQVTSAGQSASKALAITVLAAPLLPGEFCSANPGTSIVSFEDSNLEAAVRGALGVGPQADLTCDGVALATALTADNAGITSVVGVQNLTGLENLELYNNSISDVGMLSGLTSLTFLALGGNSIADITPLSGLTSLWNLYLDGNPISDIGALGGLTGLRGLGISSTLINDISALGGLTNLDFLEAGYNSITDISVLSGLTSLTNLYVWGNPISDIGALSGLTNLRGLGISSTSVSDISVLSGLTNLSFLQAAYNDITDISAMTPLMLLGYLNLDGNPSLADINPLLDNAGLGAGDQVSLRSTSVTCTDVAALEAKGVTVTSDCGPPE